MLGIIWATMPPMKISILIVTAFLGDCKRGSKSSRSNGVIACPSSTDTFRTRSTRNFISPQPNSHSSTAESSRTQLNTTRSPKAPSARWELKSACLLLATPSSSNLSSTIANIMTLFSSDSTSTIHGWGNYPATQEAFLEVDILNQLLSRHSGRVQPPALHERSLRTHRFERISAVEKTNGQLCQSQGLPQVQYPQLPFHRISKHRQLSLCSRRDELLQKLT